MLSVYPVAQTDSKNTASYLENAVAQPLNRAMMEWFLKYAMASDRDKHDPRIDVVHCNLRGLCPVTIINADLDPLRSDGEMLGHALKDARTSAGPICTCTKAARPWRRARFSGARTWVA